MIDEDNLYNKSISIQQNLVYYNKYGAPLVDEYSKDLDEKVLAIRTYLNNIRELDLTFDIPSLQKICVDLSTTIYYTSEKLEKLGLLEDMSNITFKDKYNEAYTSKQSGARQEDRKYTTDQLRAYAEQEAMEERLINFIYSHAVKVLKGKIDAANEVLKSVSKSLSAEIQSMQTYQYSNKFHS